MPLHFSIKSLFLASLLLPAASANAEDSKDRQCPSQPLKSLKLLSIGNSFSGNASRYLGEIAKSGGCELKFAHAMIGGCPLEKHYAIAMKHEQSPSDPEGMPYTFEGNKSGLKEMLSADKWQVVSIQQYSMFSFKPDTYRPYAKELVDYVKKYAPTAKIVIHQTWAYRSDDPIYKDGFTPEKMYQALTKAYCGIAAELGDVRVIPVGDAFQLVSESAEWSYVPDKDFDFKNAKYPALPKQSHSLHSGYHWQKAKLGEGQSLALDGHHAGQAGEFLGGCVWFEALFGQDARKVSFVPKDMSKEDADFLKDIAHKAVSEGVKPKAWPFTQ